MDCDSEDKENRIRGLAEEQRDKKPGGVGHFYCQEVLDVLDNLTAECDQLRALVQELAAANNALNNACMDVAIQRGARIAELERERDAALALEAVGKAPAYKSLSSVLRERETAAYERGRADERAVVVAWGRSDGAWCCSRHAIDVIERGEHVQAAGEAEKG